MAQFANWVTTITIWLDRAKKADGRVNWLASLVERMRGLFDWTGDDDENE
jgi:hypothetical protein